MADQRPVDRVVRARAFEQIRKRQLREQVKGLTPAQRMARAEDLRAFAERVALHPDFTPKDESPQTCLALLARLRAGAST